MSRVIISPAGNLEGRNPLAIWRHRELIMELALRSVRTRFRNTRFGILWAFVQPLVYMLVLNFFFGLIIRFESDVPYPVYLLTGLVAFQFFTKSITEGSRSIAGNESILRNIYINPIVFPVAAMISGIIDISFSVLILIGFLMFYGVGIGPNLIFLPIVIFFLLLLYASVHLMMSVLTLRFKDVQQLVPVISQLMFFGTPIFYQVSAIPQTYLPFYGLNPMTGLVESLRYSVLGLESAPDPIFLTVSTVVALCLAITSIVIYRSFSSSLHKYL